VTVIDFMTRDPRACTPDTTLAEAAQQMWDGDCGFLPVMDDGELVGVVTDRDMYIALATRNERASQLRVGAVATRNVATCSPADDIDTALALMKEKRIRRLPVVGLGNSLLGVVSLNDIILNANSAKVRNEVLDTLQAICTHHHPAPQMVAV
jgi:CBS domain-containing protein